LAPVQNGEKKHSQKETKRTKVRGVGFAFHVGYQIKIFAEARYHYMFTHSGSSFIPVSFGVRF